MNFDGTTITQSPMDSWGPGTERKHVHRLDRPALFTSREWAWLILLAMVIAFAVGFA